MAKDDQHSMPFGDDPAAAGALEPEERAFFARLLSSLGEQDPAAHDALLAAAPELVELSPSVQRWRWREALLATGQSRDEEYIRARMRAAWSASAGGGGTGRV